LAKGFFLHEYYGVDNSTRPNPALTLRQRRVYNGRIENQYQALPRYDVVPMADVIEHLDKQQAFSIVQHFLGRGSVLVISTPRTFFNQEFFGSPDEHHLSHWTVKDFRALRSCDYQNAGPGRIFLLSSGLIDIRGFGSAPSSVSDGSHAPCGMNSVFSCRAGAAPFKGHPASWA
jgi:hypothetical protein